MSVNDPLKRAINELIPLESKVLDIGCGPCNYSKQFPNKVGIDAWAKVNPDVLLDLEIEDLPFEENSFDHALMVDVIEHFEKERGLEILRQAQKITKGKVFILTPLWWVSNESNTNDTTCWAHGNKYNLHKSLWTKEDFSGEGWTELGFRNRLGEYYWGYWEKTMTDEKKPSPQSLALIQEFFRELQGLQRVIEKGEPFSSLAMDQIVAQVPNHPDLPKEFGELVNTAQKVIEQIKELYASGPNTERLILIQQMFAPFFKIIAAGAEKIDSFARA